MIDPLLADRGTYPPFPKSLRQDQINPLVSLSTSLEGDTVWYEVVQEVIETHKPEIIVVNGGDNQFFESGSVIMGKDDIA